jgi:hypothetical protein
MPGTHLALGAVMAVGALTATVALFLMWMFLTEPVEMAHTMRQGTTSDVARLVASVVYDLVARLLAWL